MQDRVAQMIEASRKAQAIRDRLAELERLAERSRRITARVCCSSPLVFTEHARSWRGHQHAPGLSRLRKFGNIGLRAA